MRMRVVALLLLSLSTPVCAQTVATSSGAMSMVNISDPPSTGGAGSDPTNHVITPPSVIAPGLTAAGIETCLGSASGGVSVMGGGFTFGTTKVDEGCTIRLLARQLFALGFRKAAVALMCQDARVLAAMIDAGTPCPAAPTEPAAAPTAFAPADPAPGEPLSLLPSALAEPSRSAAADEEAPVKPFTKEEAALFARATAEE